MVLSCEAAAGLSLGEYTALVFAGVLDFDDGLRLVQLRGAAMQDAADAMPSGMVSILGMERVQVQTVVEQARGNDILEIANSALPGKYRHFGQQCRLRAGRRIGRSRAMKAIPLAVAGAFHTKIMQPAVERLSAGLAKARCTTPNSGRLERRCRTHSDPAEIRELLVKQVVNPVRWEDSLRDLARARMRPVLRGRPRPSLRALLRRIDRRLSWCDRVGGGGNEMIRAGKRPG